MSHASLRRALLALLALIALAALPAAPARARQDAPALSPGLVADLDRALATTREAARAPGALLAVALPSGELYRGASGVADLASGAPLTPDARVRVASVSKAFVAAVAMQLVQEGWLRLDHSVEHWLPGLVPGGDQITVRQLLSHTSGLPDYFTDELIARSRRDPGRVWAPEELVAEALRYPRRFAPGAPGRWYYANTNYILIGMIIERVTGHPLEQELRQRVFAPLGLRGTALAAPGADPDNLAHGYGGGADRTDLNMSLAWAAGGISATSADLTRFMQGLVWGDLLAPATLGAMLDFAPTGGAWGVPDLAYGLGIMRRSLPAPGLPAEMRLALGHTGALEGYRSALWFFPASGVTIAAAFTREEADPDRVVAAALQALAAHGALGRP